MTSIRRARHRHARRALCVSLATCWLARSAGAQVPGADFPQKPIRLVVTFPPGGSSDAVVRLLVPILNARLGQQVVVDNRPGAGGNLGLAIVAKAPADGYTLGVGAAGGLAANPSLYPNMPYDPLKDFRPVGMLAAIPFVIVGHPSLDAKSLRDVVALARARPGQLSIGHGGNGTAMHLSSELFAQMADIKLVQVPYRGSGPAALDAMAGQVPLAVVDLPSALSQIKAGKLVAYAVTSPQRLPSLPEVPTVAESGLTGYDSTGWFGVVAPAETPTPIVARLNAALDAALSDDQVRSTLRGLGVEPLPGTPEAFGAYIRSETRKWAQVIKAANIKLD